MAVIKTLEISGRQKAIVLPSLILLSLVLITLSAVLLTSGTSSLRWATQAQRSEQAYQAAEAGLVHAAEMFTKLGAPDDFEDFHGELASGSSKFVVVVTKNSSATDDLVTSEGVTIPPKTSYFLSTGIAEDGSECKVGALFTLGAGSFRAGILANNVIAENSKFAAYNSLTSKDPTPTLPGKGILTSNGSILPGEPQFSLNATSVGGLVYVGKGTSPSVQVQKLNGSNTEDDRILDNNIDIPEIKVPKVERGKSGSTEDEESEEPDEDIPWTKFYSSPEANASYSTASGWSFKHHSNSGVASIGGYSGNLKIEYYSETHVRLIHNGGPPQIVPLPTAPYPSVVDPGTLKSGGYGKVTITDEKSGDGDENILEEGGVFVVRDLEITEGGKLSLIGDVPTTIYVTERLTITGQNAIANTSRVPPNLKIYYVGDKPVNLEGGSEAYFTLIAPKAEINLFGPTPTSSDTGVTDPQVDPTPEATATPEGEPSPNVDPTPEAATATTTTSFYGALVGKVVTVKNAAFYFDIATDGIGEGVDNNTFRLISRHRL